MSPPFGHVCIPSEQPTAPKGFKVVGRSGPPRFPYVGFTGWFVLVRDYRGVPLADYGAPARHSSDSGREGETWNDGCYDILEPIAGPPAAGHWSAGSGLGWGAVATPAPGTPESAKGKLSERLREARDAYLRGGVIRGWDAFADEIAALETKLASAGDGD